MPKWDKERLAVLETTSEQNMLDHKEIKIAIDKLTNVIEDLKKTQEDKFVMKKELWAVSSVVGFVAVIIGIIINVTDK